MSRSAVSCMLGFLLALTNFSVSGAEWTIQTIAGIGKKGFSGDGGPATEAELDNPFGVIRGPDGCIWFCEYSGQRIRRIRQDGNIETMAGNGSKGYEGDGGLAIKASFNLPHEIRFDKVGNLYVVDMMNHAVRKIDAKTGIIKRSEAFTDEYQKIEGVWLPASRRIVKAAEGKLTTRVLEFRQAQVKTGEQQATK